MPNVENADAFVCAILRAEDPPWPAEFDADEFAAAFVARASYQGVLPLLHDGLQRRAGSAMDWPDAVRQACRTAAMGQAMWEMQHVDLLMRMLSSLAQAGVRPVVFKGTALAYSLYPAGALRPRGDTDFIIPPGSLVRTDVALQLSGFRSEMAVSGDFISYQGSYVWSKLGGDQHALDVHWRINNSELLSRLFTHEELLAQAQPLSVLGPLALATSPVHALLLACMHRATHKQNPYYVDGVAYYSGDRLIWLYDIHLLLGVLMPAEVDDFVRLARAKGLRAVCLEGIERTQACFHTLVPPGLLTELAAPGLVEPPARYLSGGPWLQKWMDFQALGSARNRIRYARELLFPPADYMRQRYPNAGSGGLGWLYLRRAAGGVFKMLRGHADAHT